MVVSESFIWLHIPKTAGDATLAMFEALRHPFHVLDPHTDPRKHGTLVEAHARAPGSEGHAVIANLRRLPDVARSYFHHMQRHAPDTPFANGRPFAALTFRQYLDHVLRHPDRQSYDWHFDHFFGPREPDHWLQVETLAESFLSVVGRYVPVPEDAAERIRATVANVGRYDRRGAASEFSRDDMEAFYAMCPRWSRAERQEYGRLLHEAIDWTDPAVARAGV